MVIRHAIPADYDNIAHLMTLSRPDYPRTADDLRYADVHRPAHCKHQFYIAELDGKVGAFAICTQHADLYDPRQFHINVYVKEDYRRQGLGNKLFQALYNDVMQFSPESLHSRVNDGNVAGFAFATANNFTESSRRIEGRLDVATANLNGLPERLDSLEKLGITVRAFSALKDDPERDLKFHGIHTAVDALVPMDTPVRPLPYEAWRPSVIDHPQFLPDATFVAIHDGRYVGLSSLFQFVDDMAYVELTGTLPEYQRKGISTTLKMCGVAYAKEQKIPRIGVTNDAVNTGILAINQTFGFVPETTIINLQRTVES